MRAAVFNRTLHGVRSLAKKKPPPFWLKGPAAITADVGRIRHCISEREKQRSGKRRTHTEHGNAFRPPISRTARFK